MGIAHIASALLIVLTSLLPTSCHKTLPQQNSPKSPATIATRTTAATPTIRDLGEVTLTNHYETCVQLGDGKNCTLTPIMIDHHNLQITLAFQSKTSAGMTHDLSVTKIITKEGKPVEVAVGNFSLSLTPHINEN